MMLWLPAVSVLVEQVACADAFSVTFPQTVVAPSRVKLTVLVGVPDPEPVSVTVAVKVTDWPEVDGFNEDVTAVAVDALPIVCVKVADVLALKFASPL